MKQLIYAWLACIFCETVCMLKNFGENFHGKWRF